MPPDVSAQAERRCDSVCPQLADGFIVAEQAQQVQPLTESLQTHPFFICRDAFAAPSELARTCSLSPEMPKGCTPPVTFRTSGKPLAPAVAKHFFCRAQDRFTLSSAPQHKRRFFRGKSMICLRFLLRTQSCCATINQNRSVPSRVSRVRTHIF